MVSRELVFPKVIESQQRFDMKLLSRPMPDLIHKIFAMKKRLPERSGQILRMRRYNNLATATVPLGPTGVNPPPQSLSALDMDAKVEWYGSFVIITDQVSLINEDPKKCGVSKSSLIDLELLAA